MLYETILGWRILTSGDAQDIPTDQARCEDLAFSLDLCASSARYLYSLNKIRKQVWPGWVMDENIFKVLRLQLSQSQRSRCHDRWPWMVKVSSSKQERRRQGRRGSREHLKTKPYLVIEIVMGSKEELVMGWSRHRVTEICMLKIWSDWVGLVGKTLDYQRSVTD